VYVDVAGGFAVHATGSERSSGEPAAETVTRATSPRAPARSREARRSSRAA